MSAARAGPGPDRGLTGVAGLLLLGAVALGLVGQGAYYGAVQWLVGLLVAAATLLAMVARPPDREDARLLPVVPALALAAWALADAVLVGWVGALAWVGDGIWRASATLTYPNAAAAVLVPAALVVLARLGRGPRPLPLVLAATALLAGLDSPDRAGALLAARQVVADHPLTGPGPARRGCDGRGPRVSPTCTPTCTTHPDPRPPKEGAP